MTISATTNRVSYNGTGALTPLPVSFPFHAPGDLVVVETIITTGVQTTKVITTDYLITGTTDSLGHYANGGTVTPVLAFPVTVRWTIYRDPSRTQALDLVNNDNLPAESVEAAIDYQTMLIQRVADLIGRTLHQPEGDATSVGLLPSSVDRALKYLFFDGNGDPTSASVLTTGALIVSSFIEGLLDDTNAATAAATLQVVPATNGVLTTATVAADPTTTLGVASKSYVDHPALVAHTGVGTIGAFTRTAVLSGASFTLTWNTAVGHTGQMITFLHAGTSLTQVYTLDGAGTETIDGTTTYLLYTVGERLTIVSNGANWIVVDHQAKTEWVDAGVIDIQGTGGNPTKPTTPDIDKHYWRRDGNHVHLRYIFRSSSAAGSAAGTGAYLFGLPTNIAFDNNTVVATVGADFATAVMSEAVASALPGTGTVVIDSSAIDPFQLYAYNTTAFQAGRTVTFAVVGSASFALTNAEMAYYFELHARAANWRL